MACRRCLGRVLEPEPSVLLAHLHRSSSTSIFILSLRLLKRYQTSQVTVKLGSASRPGISSRREMKPSQWKKATQKTTPAKSRISPTKGTINTGAMSSTKSKPRQTTRVASSSQERPTSQGLYRVLRDKMSPSNIYERGYKNRGSMPGATGAAG